MTYYTAKELREALQAEGARLMSDWTRQDLGRVLERTRSQEAGLALQEVAEVIQENLSPEEVESLKKFL